MRGCFQHRKETVARWTKTIYFVLWYSAQDILGVIFGHLQPIIIAIKEKGKQMREKEWDEGQKTDPHTDSWF